MMIDNFPTMTCFKSVRQRWFVLAKTDNIMMMLRLAIINGIEATTGVPAWTLASLRVGWGKGGRM